MPILVLKLTIDLLISLLTSLAQQLFLANNVSISFLSGESTVFISAVDLKKLNSQTLIYALMPRSSWFLLILISMILFGRNFQIFSLTKQISAMDGSGLVFTVNALTETVDKKRNILYLLDFVVFFCTRRCLNFY